MGGQRFFAFLDEGVNGTDAAQPEACYPKNTRGKKNIYGIKKYKKNTNKARKDTKYKEKHQKKGVPGVNWLQQETLLMEPYAIPRDFIGKPAGSGRSPAFAMLPKACSSGIPAKPARDRMATETHASKT